ncbi:MAG: RNA polymerase subunit sigma-70 [Lachnospiraceae bacterium]|nr:RNA polymerase subunit sigma-70 [Lachnospiraceae bacterium]
MTDAQAAQIKEMRLNGMGYRAIADALGLSRDIVRNHCKAKGMGGYVAATVRNMQEWAEKSGICICCGKEIAQQGNGRPRKFCSEKCRRQWWKAHPEEGNRKAMYTKVCARCGKEFTAYGNGHRKYCSHDCYIKARFWRDEDGV